MKRSAWLLVLTLLGCEANGPSMGSLRVSVIGLPTGSSADITVTGPGGFSQAVTGTETIPGLLPGTYTVAATDVTVGSSGYSPAPVNQTVAVGGSQSTVSVQYSTAGGNLTVTINGMGTTGSAAVTVTGTNYSQSIGSTTTLAGLNPGSYTVTASDAPAPGGTVHSPNPPSQMVTVIARQTVGASVTYSPPPSDGTVNLRVAGFYITQSAQSYGGAIPLVKNRKGWLRVFVVADKVNSAAPFVQVRFFNALGVEVNSSPIAPPGASTPTWVDESSTSFSWNLPVAGSLIQPGYSVQIVVDPADLIDETDDNDNVFPATGTQTLTVRTMPSLDLTFVPIVQSGLTGNTSNTDTLLSYTRRMHPLDAIDLVIGSPLITSQKLLSDGTGWENVLSELDARRVAAADGRYYYGVAQVNYSFGVAGIAYVTSGTSGPQKTAMGWDKPATGGIVVAHELGHNWTRNHAPCGGPAGIDPQYPQADGSTGGYGWDQMDGALKPATSKDVMAYCDPRWISDYTYGAVLNYLSPAGPIVMQPAAQKVQPALLVWGHIRDGEMVLEPAFQLNTRPSLPVRPGPYTIEGRANDGTGVFAFSFAPAEVADLPVSQQNFAFAIPLPAASAARLSSLRLAGPGRPTVAQAVAGPSPDSLEVQPLGAGRVALRWNAKAHPMVMVRDPRTGEVLSFARGGSVELPVSPPRLDLVISNGVNSRLRRVQVSR